MVDLQETLRRAASSKHVGAVWIGTGAFIGGSAAQTMGGGFLVTALSLAAGAAFGMGVGRLIDGIVPSASDADSMIRPARPQALDFSARTALRCKDLGPGS